MAKWLLGLSSIFLFGFLYGADVIKNPAIPLNKKPGKVLALKEVLQIRDDHTNNFYLKYPDEIKIGYDGSIFVCDDKEILKFDANGQFKANFYKFGQGPGETISVPQYLLRGKKLIIYDSAINKFIFVNHETGEMIKEFRLYNVSYHDVLSCNDDNIFLLKTEHYDTYGKFEILDIEMSLISVSMDGKNVGKKIGFPTKHLIINSGDNSFVSRRARFLICHGVTGLIYISHTPVYEIKYYNIEKNEIIKIITRDYDRVKVTEKTKKYAPGGNIGRISIDEKKWYKVPVDKYHLDIQKLFRYKNKLWVITSTVKDNKKILVDVYDNNGIYINNFYIEYPPGTIPFQIKGWMKAIKGDFLYAVEDDKEGQKYIKIYKIEYD